MSDPGSAPAQPVRFLALGDSYTIGEQVAPSERWPVQLASLLRRRHLQVLDPEIIARTGWTTDELSAAIAQAPPRGPYQLVSLLIGVNDQFRGRDVESYRTRFVDLLREAIGFAGGDSQRVIVLSIPDWSVTPYAADRDRVRISGEIDLFNAVNRAETARAGARYVDITSRSRDVEEDSTLVGLDGLHPVGRMYDSWAAAALPAALAALGLGGRAR
jgi:lysophospholipase L1-like esterase